MTNSDPSDLQESLRRFVRYRQEHLTGDEKGEAQVFLDHLFTAFGHEGLREAGATLEMRLRRRSARGTAFADLVWKPRVLIEMKKAGEPLHRHYPQAFEYWINAVPDRPRFVVLCNFDEFWIYDLNLQLDEPVDRVLITELPRRWEALAFLLPSDTRPVFGNDLVAVTRESAARVSGVFNLLVERGVDRRAAQRFILQAVMAMFGEDIGLLPRHLFSQAVTDALDGASAYDLIFGLLREMNTPGATPAGRYAGTPYFNGGLFRTVTPLELERQELEALHAATQENWSEVRPVIFGTLFEQSLDKDERHAYGAHFTSEVDIQKVVRPTIVYPWRERIDAATTLEELGQVEDALLRYRVLDPACGCGNFLFVAYRELRRLEKQLAEKTRERRRRARAADEMQLAFVSTNQFHGIDVNPFAVEIAKVTLMLARKLAAEELGDLREVLPLDDLDENFQVGDALELGWPRFDACIGNPPYLGRRRLIDERGAVYAARLAALAPEVRGVSDYVVYWFRKAHDLLPTGGRAGLVGTNAIRRGSSRQASLDYVVDHDGVIFDAVSSQPWSGDAAVHVSIVNWAKGVDVTPKQLWLSNGTVRLAVDQITGSLSPTTDLRDAVRLRVNTDPKRCFQGQTPGHTRGFVLSQEEARELVQDDPGSAAVVHPYLIGEELLTTGEPSRFLIDIPAQDGMTAHHMAPVAFRRIREHVLFDRKRSAQEEERRNAEVLKSNPKARINRHHQQFLDTWWQLSYRREAMLEAIRVLPRYIAVSRVATRHRLPVLFFVSPEIRPGDALCVFAFADDYSFGVLQSTLHLDWFIELCSTLKSDLRYTANVFEKFPWPQAPSNRDVIAVVEAVVALLDFRAERQAQGIPVGRQYDSLRDPGRSRLRDLHEELDRAVFDAYGFDRGDDTLAQLLALNASIAEEETAGLTRPRGPGSIGFPDVDRTTWRIEPSLQLSKG